MKKLHELLRVNRQHGDFGVEIECEGNNLFPAANDVWNTVPDGSLRGQFPNESCEWVLREPLPLKEAIEAVNWLADANKKATLNFSFRTSVHIHMNVQDLTFEEYMTLVYTYLLVEEPMMRFCGDQRIGNRFCLRVQDAEAFLDHVEAMADMGAAFIRNIYEDQIRYASLNLAATKKYGSVEFRGMRGTLDPKVLTTWISAISRLRDFAKEQGSPMAVHDLFVKSRVEDFLSAVFGELSEEFGYKGVIDDVRRSFSLTLNIPYKFANYKANLKPEKEEVKPKVWADLPPFPFDEPPQRPQRPRPAVRGGNAAANIVNPAIRAQIIREAFVAVPDDNVRF